MQATVQGSLSSRAGRRSFARNADRLRGVLGLPKTACQAKRTPAVEVSLPAIGIRGAARLYAPRRQECAHLR